jgi:KaiC/GvpD/RAD55 family RecA-like ATPase
VKLRLSDPVYTERLVAFLEDVGHAPAHVADGAIELAREIPEEELAVYLRVWSVLEPEATVTVE